VRSLLADKKIPTTIPKGFKLYGFSEANNKIDDFSDEVLTKVWNYIRKKYKVKLDGYEPDSKVKGLEKFHLDIVWHKAGDPEDIYAYIGSYNSYNDFALISKVDLPISDLILLKG
jgi:hypothetical protein